MDGTAEAGASAGAAGTSVEEVVCSSVKVDMVAAGSGGVGLGGLRGGGGGGKVEVAGCGCGGRWGVCVREDGRGKVRLESGAKGTVGRRG